MTAVATQNAALVIASVVSEGGALTVAQMRANRALMRELMESEMEEGKHYGKVPGVAKPSLFKPGAELLLVLFKVDAKPIIEDLSTSDSIRYRITMEGVHMPTGIVVGHGVGEASTSEDKYNWRRTFNNMEWNATPEDRRRMKYGYNRETREEYEERQIRTNPADAANTILKMASKRAKVDLALSVTAASDVFSQDVEEMEKWLKENESDEGDRPPPREQSRKRDSTRAPQPRAEAQSGAINPGQLDVLRKSIDDAGVPEADFLKRYDIARLEDLQFAKLNDALLYCKAVKSGSVPQ